jgi:hypothetical protein
MPPVLRRAVTLTLALVGAFALDALAFRTRFYPSNLKTDSTTGLFELVLWRERQAQTKLGDNAVLTIGDSRFGIVPKLSNALEPETGYVFRSAGVAGTDARSWFYMLRDLDPGANRYRAIILGLNDYEDEDLPLESDDDIRALHYCIARLRIADSLDFARSFRTLSAQWEAFRGALFKGLVYQADLHEFLVNPRARIRAVRFERSGFEEWTYNFLGNDVTMQGLEIDWSTLTARYPPNAPPNQHETVEGFLLRKPLPQAGHMSAFRREWFGRIAARYRNSRTKVIFMHLPRGPIPRPPFLARSTGSAARELASQPNVMLMDEHAFESLERPELFADGMHLNKQGVALFSTMLARNTAAMLGPPR